MKPRTQATSSPSSQLRTTIYPWEGQAASISHALQFHAAKALLWTRLADKSGAHFLNLPPLIWQKLHLCHGRLSILEPVLPWPQLAHGAEILYRKGKPRRAKATALSSTLLIKQDCHPEIRGPLSLPEFPKLQSSGAEVLPKGRGRP